MQEISWEILHPADKVLAYLAAARLRKETLESSGVDCPTILVVDDEETVANTTCEILNLSGFCAFVAYDGETALDLASKLRPDILFTDVLMPGMNGIELAIAVSRRLPQVSILLISGQAGTIDLLEKARQAGHSFQVLAKPIHPSKLIEQLNRLRRA